MAILHEWTGGWGGRRRKCCQDEIGKYLKTLFLLYLTIVSNGNMKSVHGNSMALNEGIVNVTTNSKYPNRLTNQQISIQSQSIATTESVAIPTESQSLSSASACSCKIAIVNKNALVDGVHAIDCIITCQSDGKYEGFNSSSNIDTDRRRQKPLKFKRTDEQQDPVGASNAEDIQKNELRSEDVVVVRHRRHSESVIDEATTDSVRGTMSLVEPTDNGGRPTISMSSNIQPNSTSAADSLSPQHLVATAITMAPTAAVLSAETVDYSATTEEFFIKHVDMVDTYENFTQSTTTCSPDDENCLISLHNSTCVGEEIYCNYTYEEYVDMLYDYIYPTVPEWILIFSHAVVFFMGLVSTYLYSINIKTQLISVCYYYIMNPLAFIFRGNE